MSRRLAAIAVSLAVVAAAAPAAFAAFPYTRPAGNPHDFSDLYLSAGQTPSDLSGDGNEFKFAATPDPSNGPQVNQNPVELSGVRGAHVGDADPSVRTAWTTTTGRPDVGIAVLDSGIKWNDAGAMDDLRLKVRLNKGELPVPQRADASSCGAYDCNGDGVFNAGDYGSDSRVDLSDQRRVGPAGVITPQDLIIAFSQGTDGDSNGFVDDIAGWDFLDNDNDPFDDVQYGHGTGEASDSGSEADNGRQVGSCPNCMVLPLRVGDSFIADDNRFAQATLYATDRGMDVVQEALGTLNNSSLGRQAVEYAYRHGVTVIASAADEAAQHNNWPSSLPHVILVNSVTTGIVPSPNQSYVSFNGCTNFNSKITLAIPSTSCSSNATGLAAGMAGLVYSAALNAKHKSALNDYPDPAGCKRVNGSRCVITPNEVRQVMATGAIGGTSQADDVNFAGSPPQGAEPSCSPVPAPGCTDPGGPAGSLQAQVDANRQVPIGPPGLFQSYPARKGPDQFYGYGRVNMARALAAVLANHAVNPPRSRIPPEAEIASPEWYEQVRPSRATLEVKGQVFARGASYICEVLVAPGQYPNNARTTDNPPGDFAPLRNGWCDSHTSHRASHSGSLGRISIAQLRSRFPAGTNFSAPEPQASPANDNGRPNAAPHSFTVKLVVRMAQATPTRTGRDQRAAYLKRDQGMLGGFPRAITRGAITTGSPTSDGESSPVLADLDADNRNELIVGGSDGFVHALRPDGTELPGWPVRGERPPLHTGQRAFRSGEVSSDIGGAILGSIAVADANGDGAPEVYADDLEGKVYGWNASGARVFRAQANPRFSGKPLQPFVNSRHGEANRTQRGFLASPVIADLGGDGKQEIIAAGMDRHLYAWHSNGDPVAGFPVLVVDPGKVQSIDPQTHQVTFNGGSGSFQQGAIVDTPAVADLTGDGRPEIVVGTNEEYDASQDGGWNAAPANGASFNLLDQLGHGVDQFKSACGSPCDDVPGVPLKPANSRVYAIHPDGNAHSGGDPFLSGWPAKVAIVNAELLPVVGEGITGYPIVGDVDCGSGPGPKVGVMANNGLAYVFDVDGQSCYGRSGGADIPLQTDGYANQPDHPLVPAVGLPAFSDLDGTGLSFVAPAAGLQRALDVALPDYQPAGQDFLAAWSVEGGGQLRTPSFPQPVNDLQFLTGPSIADLNGLPGQEIVAGTASMDLNAFSAAGTEVQGWPKLSTDWTVANPTVGSFGTRDTSSTARKAVIAETRSGYINAYSTSAPACSPSTWPRFHHDGANSGDYERDATLPGKPFGLHATAARITFQAPGDDLLCGTADRYRVVTSSRRIDEANFKAASPLAGAPAPASAGTSQAYQVPPSAKRYVAIRAVDEAGNVGRPAVADLGG